MSHDFRNLWIVGASTGIGRDCALAFASLGVNVIASARSIGALETLAAQGGGRIHAVPCDITDPASVQSAYATAKSLCGEIDAVLIAAAWWNNDAGDQAQVEKVKPALEVNVLGSLRIIEAVMPAMKARGRGRLAIVSSVAGFRGLPRGLAYGASKAALTYVAECLRLACDPDIIVQVIHPGFVKTPLTDKNDFPMPFIMTSPAAAQRIVNGMAGKAFEITFPKRFTMMLKLLRILPYALYFPLVRRMTGSTQDKGSLAAPGA
jgi:NAD(P)-dependent dehydrogenase (short-subunit alcohol dehydrogenase family)